METAKASSSFQRSAKRRKKGYCPLVGRSASAISDAGFFERSRMPTRVRSSIELDRSTADARLVGVRRLAPAFERLYAPTPTGFLRGQAGPVSYVVVAPRSIGRLTRNLKGSPPPPFSSICGGPATGLRLGGVRNVRRNRGDAQPGRYASSAFPPIVWSRRVNGCFECHGCLSGNHRHRINFIFTKQKRNIRYGTIRSCRNSGGTGWPKLRAERRRANCR
jgi:hypothetical protein